MGHASFQHLPQELQDMILLSLSKHDLAVCALVSQAWFDFFAPVVLDAIVEVSACSSPLTFSSLPLSLFPSSLALDVAVAAPELCDENDWGRGRVLTVLDAYQRITAWLLAQGVNADTTARKDDSKNNSAVTGRSMTPEPVIPKISEPAVEMLLRNSHGLQELRISGEWKSMNHHKVATSRLSQYSVRSGTDSKDSGAVTLFPVKPPVDKRPPYPLCKLDTLHLNYAHYTLKDASLLSFMEQSPLSPTSSSSSSGHDARDHHLRVRMSRGTKIPMEAKPASLIAAIPASLSRLVLERLDGAQDTCGMLSASWRTIEGCGPDCPCHGHAKRRSSAPVLSADTTLSSPHRQQQQYQDQQAFLFLRRIHHTALDIEKMDLLPFLRRFNNLHEVHFCLSKSMMSYCKDIAEALSTSCPTLNVGVFGGHRLELSDENLAYLIGASSRGWKTLATDTNCVFGQLSARTLIRSRHHTSTLENFRVTTGALDFPSAMIQELLCCAKRLKRFEGRSWLRDWAPMLHISASDLVQGMWVCTELETFHCAITGIPRPDVKTRKNGRPLKCTLHEGESMEQSVRVQKLVYQQLGRLTKLRELVLGYRSCDADESVGGFVTDEDRWWEQGISEAQCYRDRGDEDDGDGDSDKDKVHEEEKNDLRIGLLYDTLSVSLESGLELLKGLGELTWLSLEGTSHRVKEAERRWMKQQWPRMFTGEDRDGVPVARDVFWTPCMINGYHSTESWYNNWPDVEARLLK